MSSSVAVLIAVDPGRDKCGVAVVGAEGEALVLRVVPRAEVAACVAELFREHEPPALIVGDRTDSPGVIAELSALGLGIPLYTASEHNTTLRARERYFQDNPPHGPQRIVPRGLLLPPRPVDDYAALVMAEDWLASPHA